MWSVYGMLESKWRTAGWESSISAGLGNLRILTLSLHLLSRL